MSAKNKLESILHKFKSRAYEPETLFLLNRSDSLELIQDMKNANLKIAGIEGFRVFPEGGVQPLQDYSNDIVDFDRSYDDFIQETVDLISRIDSSHIYFQIVTD